MKRSLRWLLASTPLFLSTFADAKDLPNYNAYYDAKRVPAAASSTPSAPPAYASSIDDRRGVPTFLWAARPVVSGQASLAGLSPEAAARAHLERHAARYGITKAAIATAKVQQIHDLGRGGIVVVLRQAPGGIEVLRNDVKVMLDRNLDLVAIGGHLHPDGAATPKGPGFVIGDRAAIAAAFKDLYGAPLASNELVDLKKTKASYRYYDLAAPKTAGADKLRFEDPARVKRVWFALPDRLVPAYFVELLVKRAGDVNRDAYAYVIAADDGRLLYRENLTHHDTFNYRVYADPTGDHRPWDGPIADWMPHPTGVPDGSAPAFAAPNLISIDGFNKFKDPWLAPNATQTTGNNVDAYTDDDSPDGFSGGSDIRATLTSPNTFDRTYDTSLGPQSSDTQRMASVTSLFYTTNWLHDWWYDSGFDEAAGNAQKDNLGRGGIAGDPLRAEAQDGAPQQRDNSNMSAMGDGASPRMQMFVWDGAGTQSLTVTPGGTLNVGVADFGPQSFNTTGAVVLVNDGTAPVTDACENIQNNIAGKIALIDRGICSFKSKVVKAQMAGAIGVIIANNQGGGPPPLGDDGTPTQVTIPVLGISLSAGNALKSSLMNGAVNATLTRAGAPDRDGTLDNAVVAHEWGHYIHLRQVACGSAACAAESEGWGDFFALHMGVRQGDDVHGAFPLAVYATASFPDDPAYFGIRRYPYSVDLAKNPLTFKYIADSTQLPANVPVAQSTAQINNSEAHAAGEVWAAMLFEAYAALIEESQKPGAPYTFDEARRRMGDYVEGGLKLAPTDPTYTEQRDAILAAAAAADPADLQILAQAFARRGAGTCAVSPPRDSQDFEGVVESFVVQANLTITSITVDDSVKACDSDGSLDAEETGKVTVTVINTGTAPIAAATGQVTSTASGLTFPAGSTLNFGAIAPLSTATASIDVALAASLTTMQTAGIKVDLQGVSSCSAQGMETAPLVNFDEVPASATTDTVEAKATAWLISGNGGDQIWSRKEPKLGNHVWAGIDYPSPSDTSLMSPLLEVSMTDPFTLTFDHRHAYEQSMGVNWDGSVIEVSTDNGAHWSDISTYGDPSYDDTIGDPQHQATNALSDRQGYVGQNASYPMMDTIKIDMGTKLAGKTVRVRFRIGTDDAAGNSGWELDNIAFTGITNKPFASIVDDKSSCGAPPIADAGPDQTVTSGDVVTLDGTKSFDPASLPLSYAWTLVSGPSATLSGATTNKATFTAPSVTAPTKMTFQLDIDDGKATAKDTVDITVVPGMMGTGGEAPDGGADGGDVLIPSSGAGCNCTTSGGDPGPGAAAALLGLAAILGRRRRNRK